MIYQPLETTYKNQMIKQPPKTTNTKPI